MLQISFALSRTNNTFTRAYGKASGKAFGSALPELQEGLIHPRKGKQGGQEQPPPPWLTESQLGARQHALFYLAFTAAL